MRLVEDPRQQIYSSPFSVRPLDHQTVLWKVDRPVDRGVKNKPYRFLNRSETICNNPVGLREAVVGERATAD